MKASTYLHFKGNCEEVIDFYADVLGGEITRKMYFKDAPSNVFVAPNFAKNWIMHTTLIAGDLTLMASDFLNENEELKIGNNFVININTNYENEAITIFNSLIVGGFVFMPFEIAFWGGKFGMLRDKYGVQWMISLNDASQANI